MTGTYHHASCVSHLPFRALATQEADQAPHDGALHAHDELEVRRVEHEVHHLAQPAFPGRRPAKNAMAGRESARQGANQALHNPRKVRCTVNISLPTPSASRPAAGKPFHHDQDKARVSQDGTLIRRFVHQRHLPDLVLNAAPWGAGPIHPPTSTHLHPALSRVKSLPCPSMKVNSYAPQNVTVSQTMFGFPAP